IQIRTAARVCQEDPRDDRGRQRAGAGKWLGRAFPQQPALEQRHADRQGHGALRRRCHGRGRARRPGAYIKARAAEADLDRVWREEWAAMADRIAGAADTAAAEGRHITAGHHYMRAGNYYYTAARSIPPGAEKMAMYRKALRAYHAAMERLHPEIERVEVPYEGTSLPAYFVRGAGSGQRPTVVLFDGMDNAKEMSVIFAGLDFAKRGINTLAIDGPGQAEALRLRNIH